MNRAFISLYLIIVVSVVLLGLSFNKFWDQFSPADEISPAVQNLFRLTESGLDNGDEQYRLAKLQEINRHLQGKFELLKLGDFADNEMLEAVKRGKIISAATDSTEFFYKRLSSSDYVLALSLPAPDPHQKFWYFLFIVVFYLAIALAIFLWVWPLSRDLARLARHTSVVGKAGKADQIQISSRSVLYPFARAFNSMARRLEELLRSQKEMTYAVSHELRTPLARVKFALAMIDDGTLPNRISKQLDSIHQDALEMEALINALLTYASFDQEDRALEQRPGHMRDLLEAMVARLQLARDNRVNGRVTIEIHDETRDSLFICEWSLMQTAVQNLLENALDFANRRILVTLGMNGGNYQIAVEDDGRGVAAEDRERIFESFVRLHQDNRSGFGLGLAIVARVLRWHKGNAYCQSSPLGGAKFLLVWPKL